MRVRIEEIVIGSLAGGLAGAALLSSFAAGRSLLPPADWPAWLAAIAALIGAVIGGWLLADQPETEHVRGVRYIADPARARRALEAHEAALAGGPPTGVEIGGVKLARKREVGHMYICGLPGSGKTVLLSSIIRQALRRGDLVFVHDPKGDYTAQIESCLLGPWDERAALWAIGRDVATPPQAVEFARVVIGRGGERGDNAFFYDNASRLLAAVIIGLQNAIGEAWSWSDLYQQLARPPKDLIAYAAEIDPMILAAFPSADMGGEWTGAEKSILSTLAQRTAWLASMAAVDDGTRRPFAFRPLLRNVGTSKMLPPIAWNNNANYATAAESLFGAMLAILASIIASPDLAERDASAPGAWLILDEFPQLGKEAIRAIQKIEEIGRSRGIRVVKALQDESQITALLGRDAAGPILSMQSTKVYCRCADGTAHEVAKRIGEREVRAYRSTAEHGAVAGKQAETRREPVLTPDALMGLHVTDRGPEILVHIEDTIGRLVQPFGPRPDHSRPAFVESAAWRDGLIARQPARPPTPTPEPATAAPTPIED
jgi:hypothetical protein